MTITYEDGYCSQWVHPHPTGQRVRTLYVVEEDGYLLTHDGNCQLGCYKGMTLEEFLAVDRGGHIKYVEVHWAPDAFGNRYKRANFQSHMKASGEKDVLETDT